MVDEKNVKYLPIEEFLNKKLVDVYTEITNEYPEMEPKEQERVAYDIGINGVLSPLLAIKRGNKYLIIDGRNRYNLISDLYTSIKDNENDESNIKVKEKIEFIPIEIIKDTGIDNLKMIADGLNLSRRHLTATQKSIIAFSERFEEQREYFSKLAETNKKGGKKADESILNVEALAKATGGNKEYTQRWKNVEDFFTEISVIDGEETKTYIDKDKLDKLKKHAYTDSKRYQVICNIFRFPKNSGVDIKDETTRNSIVSVIDEVLTSYASNASKSININELKKKYNLPVQEASDEKEESTRGKKHNINAGDLGVYLNFRVEKDQMERLTIILKQAFEETGLYDDFKIWFLNDETNKQQVSDTIKDIAGKSLGVTDSKDFEGKVLPDEY